MALLKTGDKAPIFELLDQNNHKVSSSDYSGQKLLIYFYPKADTPGCTTQSCSVRDAIEDLSGLNMAAIGISPDAPEKQLKFDEKFTLGFPLLSDPDHEVAEAYGAWGEKKNYGKTSMGIIRSSFLIDEAGKIAQVAYKVKPEDTVPKAKAAVETA
jgi:peroxiredoxin Q/BCP